MPSAAKSDSCLGNLRDKEGSPVIRCWSQEGITVGIGPYSHGMLEQGVQEDFLRIKYRSTKGEREREGVILTLELQRDPAAGIWR